MNKLKLPDADARRKIKTDLNTTFLVEAGAGSGKTKSLVDRMLALLAAGECKINNIAAVTFTRKAAAELRGRFQTELERTVVGMQKSETRERLAQALHFLEQSFIGTIHSFCAKLLRERPIEIALDPDFEEMEEIENSVFREKCWHDFLDKEKAEGSLLEKELEDVGLSPHELKNCFKTLSDYPEVEFKPGSEKQPDYKSLRKNLEYFLEQARDIVPKYRPENGYDGLQSLMHSCFLRQKNLGFKDHRILMETYELLDKKAVLTQNRWPTAEQGKAFQDKFEAFRESSVREAVREWREYRHIKVFLFLKPALEFCEKKRLTHAKLNFQDQLLFTSRLLRDNPEVREYFSLKFTHILVDEFQDTDPIQAEMLLYLTGKNIKERDWKKLMPRAGSLFLVGDPKQSIFRFRRADIDTYNLVKKQIIKSGGDVLFLNTNFRSLHSLRDWVNPVMLSVFPENSNDFQAAFAPLETLRSGDEKFKGVYKITIPRQKGNKEEIIVDIDSKRIAEFISWACKGNIKLDRTKKEIEEGLDEKAQPSDFLILLRYRKKMSFYARALEKKGLPFEITGGDAFSESEDIREIVNLVKALNSPDNEIYTVAVLRGLFFGVSDDKLFNFKQSGGRFYFLGLQKKEHGKEGKRAAEALFTLHKWWYWMREDPVSVALEKIFEDSGVINYIASTEMGKSKAGNAFKLLELLREKEIEGVTSLAGLSDYLEELTSIHEIEELSLTPGRKNAVRLMNLHKAKGLEAPVVFLANPKGIRKHEPDKHIKRTGKKSEGYFVLSKKINEYYNKIISQPTGWAKVAEEEKKYEAAEKDRLNYVAATRAKNCLILSTYAERLGDNKAWGFLDSFLGQVKELEGPTPLSQEDISSPAEKLILEKGEWKDAKKEIKKRINALHKHSYTVDSVTNVAKAGRKRPGWQENGGGGFSWGNIVHQMLEAIGKGETDNMALRAENALTSAEIDIREKARLMALIESIRRSNFWSRVMKSEKKYFEVPFSVKVDNGKNNTPFILTGAIDLVFYEKGGWVIADYKTDKITGDLEDFISYYSSQIKEYAKYWEKITGQKVKEAGFYFTSINKWVSISRKDS